MTLGTAFSFRPFAESRAIRSFAEGLLGAFDGVPAALRLSIEAELDRSDGVSGDAGHERLRARFLARIAVGHIAPQALRRAGYARLAGEVSSGAICPSFAQHRIGRQYSGVGVMPALPSIAYGACAHASVADFYANRDDIDVAVSAGKHCAWALIGPLSYPEFAATARVWDFAMETIGAAIDVAAS